MFVLSAVYMYVIGIIGISICNALYGFVPPMENNNVELLGRRMYAKDVALKPAYSTRIRSFNAVQSLAGCMAKCPGRPD